MSIKRDVRGKAIKPVMFLLSPSLFPLHQSWPLYQPEQGRLFVIIRLVSVNTNTTTTPASYFLWWITYRSNHISLKESVTSGFSHCKLLISERPTIIQQYQEPRTILLYFTRGFTVKHFHFVDEENQAVQHSHDLNPAIPIQLHVLHTYATVPSLTKWALYKERKDRNSWILEAQESRSPTNNPWNLLKTNTIFKWPTVSRRWYRLRLRVHTGTIFWESN